MIFTHNNILIVNVIGDADLHLLFFYLCAVINEKYYEKDLNIIFVCMFVNFFIGMW